MRQVTKCPICKRRTLLTRDKLAATHNDKAGNLCPMSGHPIGEPDPCTCHTPEAH